MGHPIVSQKTELEAGQHAFIGQGHGIRLNGALGMSQGQAVVTPCRIWLSARGSTTRLISEWV